MKKAKVYFTKEITPESLIRIYQALGKELNGKVGVKISTGEPGGHNYLHPELIGNLVHLLDGTIIECCTAYGGQRQDPKLHWKAIEEHGFKAMAPCDIMDEFGEMEIPVEGAFTYINVLTKEEAPVENGRAAVKLPACGCVLLERV